jgi:hypothetical protein
MSATVDRSKTDANQARIVEALRASGCFVQSLAGVGKGCPDLAVATDGRWFVLEVKDGSKPPSQRKLTEDEIKWHRKASEYGPVWIVYDEIGALWVVGKTNETPQIKPVRMVD